MQLSHEITLHEIAHVTFVKIVVRLWLDWLELLIVNYSLLLEIGFTTLLLAKHHCE